MNEGKKENNREIMFSDLANSCWSSYLLLKKKKKKFHKEKDNDKFYSHTSFIHLKKIINIIAIIIGVGIGNWINWGEGNVRTSCKKPLKLFQDLQAGVPLLVKLVLILKMIKEKHSIIQLLRCR